MNRTVSTFLLIAILTAALAAASLALEGKGYQFGALGLARLDALAGATTFIPLAAIYASAAVLMMILPLRPAGFVHASAASPLSAVAVALLATIVGIQCARAAFGDHEALWALIDWRFVFAAAIIGVHLVMSELRRNFLLRSIFVVVFLAATLACLYWTFRL
jgi:hypothetical protein